MNIYSDRFIQNAVQNTVSPRSAEIQNPSKSPETKTAATEPVDRIDLSVNVNSEAALKSGKMKTGRFDKFVTGIAGNKLCRETVLDTIRIGSIIPGALCLAIQSPVLSIAGLGVGIAVGGIMGFRAAARLDKWLDSKVIQKNSMEKAAEFGKSVDKLIDKNTGELKDLDKKGTDEISVEEEWVDIDGVHLPKKIKNLIHNPFAGFRNYPV